MLWTYIVGREWHVCHFKSSEKEGDKLHIGQPATVLCLGQWSNLVSGILGERCHNQWRAICADVKEVNNEFVGYGQTWRWAKSSSNMTVPDPTLVCAQGRQLQQLCGLFFPILPAVLILHPLTAIFLALERCTLKVLLCKWWQAEAQCVCVCVCVCARVRAWERESARALMQCHMQRWRKCVNNEGDFVKK